MKDSLTMREKEFSRQEKNDQLKTDRTLRDIHESSMKMLRYASATSQDLATGAEPRDVADSCKRLLNCKTHGLAHVELGTQFRNAGYHDIHLVEETT